MDDQQLRAVEYLIAAGAPVPHGPAAALYAEVRRLHFLIAKGCAHYATRPFTMPSDRYWEPWVAEMQAMLATAGVRPGAPVFATGWGPETDAALHAWIAAQDAPAYHGTETALQRKEPPAAPPPLTEDVA